MAKHWTKYLPDIGRALFFKAENQELLTARINRLENEIKRLKSEYNAEEKYLITKYWRRQGIEVLLLNFAQR